MKNPKVIAAAKFILNESSRLGHKGSAILWSVNGTWYIDGSVVRYIQVFATLNAQPLAQCKVVVGNRLVEKKPSSGQRLPDSPGRKHAARLSRVGE